MNFTHYLQSLSNLT